MKNLLNPSILLIRVWLGGIMIMHSLSYLLGGKMDGFINYLKQLGFFLPEIMAYVSQLTELICAILILLGVRWSAGILAIHMLIAVIFAHDFKVFGEGELAFNYFVFALVLFLTGMGKPSIWGK
jgi:uncharacterized membrane protein YphA (DoxX/SURF4 family)